MIKLLGVYTIGLISLFFMFPLALVSFVSYKLYESMDSDGEALLWFFTTAFLAVFFLPIQILWIMHILEVIK